MGCTMASFTPVMKEENGQVIAKNYTLHQDVLWTSSFVSFICYLLNPLTITINLSLCFALMLNHCQALNQNNSSNTIYYTLLFSCSLDKILVHEVDKTLTNTALVYMGKYVCQIFERGGRGGTLRNVHDRNGLSIMSLRSCGSPATLKRLSYLCAIEQNFKWFAVIINVPVIP